MEPNLVSHILAKMNYWSLNNIQHHKQIIKLHSSIFQLFHSNLTYPHSKKSTEIIFENFRMFKIGSKIGNLRIRKLTLLRNTEKTSPSWLSLD